MNPLPFLQKIGASLMIPVAAAARHESQTGRNPYHLRLPAFMLDTVRRGGELINGQYAASPDMDFATLYKVSRWKNNALHAMPGRNNLRAADQLTRSMAGIPAG